MRGWSPERVAHAAGGRLVGGAVKLRNAHDKLGALHQGEVVEISVSNASEVGALIDKLRAQLAAQHLQPVPVGRLMHDAGQAI